MNVEIVRSARRRKTVSARVVDDRVIVSVPAGMSASEQQRWAERMLKRVEAAANRVNLNTDRSLDERAKALNLRYFGGDLRPAEVSWVTNQTSCFGSCSPRQATIRISHRLAGVPPWVLDYVLVHELAHLVHADHSRRFWKVVNRYPLTERARGFLIARGLDSFEDNWPTDGPMSVAGSPAAAAMQLPGAANLPASAR